MLTADQRRMKYNLPNGCPVQSPWGAVDGGEAVGDGLFSVSTSSHGGMFVPDNLNRTIPEPFRRKDRWYEEDCDYAIVIFFLPKYFTQEQVEQARKVLKCWKWQQWEEHFKEEVPESESSAKASVKFREQHKNS